MAAEPKLLIADEAMAGLSHSEVEDIVALLMRLNERGITIIMIEHIMRAVMSFSQRLVVLVSGKKIADGKPEDVINDPEVVRSLSWPVASPSTASMPPTARCACSRTSRSRRRRRDRRAARHQRQRQEHADEVHHGHGAAERRPHHRRDRRRRRTTSTGLTTEQIVDLGIALVPEGRRLFPKLTVEENLLLGAFRPTARAKMQRNLDDLLRDFPAPRRAPQPARRQHERRRAADAGARPRADAGAEDPAGRRAVGRPRADAGQPHHRRDQGAEGAAISSPC